jgi:hypothetical protein
VPEARRPAALQMDHDRALADERCSEAAVTKIDMKKITCTC